MRQSFIVLVRAQYGKFARNIGIFLVKKSRKIWADRQAKNAALCACVPQPTAELHQSPTNSCPFEGVFKVWGSRYACILFLSFSFSLFTSKLERFLVVTRKSCRSWIKLMVVQEAPPLSPRGVGAPVPRRRAREALAPRESMWMLHLWFKIMRYDP